MTKTHEENQAVQGAAEAFLKDFGTKNPFKVQADAKTYIEALGGDFEVFERCDSPFAAMLFLNALLARHLLRL